MNFGPEALDLIVLAADRHIAASVETLLGQRRADLGIRAVSFDVRRHPESDPGCRTKAAEFLRPLIRRYRYALVVFDHPGCSSGDAPGEIQREIEGVLGRNGWTGRSKAIVIAPELEAWVWAPSGEVAQTLGWKGGFEPLRKWLEEQGSWSARSPKPGDPKKALKQALRRNSKVPSSALFKTLAASVAFDGCRDPAFNELRHTLQAWFPPRPSTARVRVTGRRHEREIGRGNRIKWPAGPAGHGA